MFISALIRTVISSVTHRRATAGFYINMILSLSFIAFRKIPQICTNFQNEEGDICKFSWKESESMIYLLIVTAFKNRMAISGEQIVLNTLMFAKLVNVVLFYRVDYRLAVLYGLAWLVKVWLFHDDFLEGGESTTYFNHTTLESELEENPKTTWVVLFFTAWSNKCNAVSPVFSELSEEYSKEFLKFGKIDIGKYPEAGIKYGVRPNTTSQQLPTIIVFEQGEMTNWRPAIGNKQKLVKYVFSKENIERDFALNKLVQLAAEKAAKKKPKANKKLD